MQCLDRHIHAIAVEILEDQKFTGLFRDLHRLQADVPPDAVFFVHHRRAGVEVLKVAQDGFRIDRRALSAALLPGPGAEELRLGDDRDPRLRECQAAEIRRDRQRQGRGAGRKAFPARHHVDSEPMPAQHVVEHLASAGRVGGDQHPSIELGKKAVQGGERTFRPRVDSQVARLGRWEVAHVRDSRAESGVGLERLEGDGGEAVELRFELARLDEELRRREHRPLDVVPAILVASRDPAPGLVERSGQGGVVHDDRVGGKIVEQRRRLLEEERQVELDTRRRHALTDTAVDRGSVWISFEARTEAPSELPYRLRIQWHFARRQEADAVERIERALRFRIEAADGLDLLIEEIDPQRRRPAHREDIEQRAAHRELAGARDLTDAGVACIRQPLAERLERKGLSAHELESAALDVLLRRQPLHERVRGHDQTSVPGLRQLEERPQPLRDDVRMRREEIVRQHFPVGERKQRQALTREEAQLRRQPIELPGGIGHDDIQPLVAMRGLGERQGRRAAMELVPAQMAPGGAWYVRIEDSQIATGIPVTCRRSWTGTQKMSIEPERPRTCIGGSGVAPMSSPRESSDCLTVREKSISPARAR